MSNYPAGYTEPPSIDDYIDAATKDLQQKLLASQASEARLRDLVKHLRPKFGAVGARDIDVAKTQAMFDEAISSVNTAELDRFVSESVESEIERRFEVVAWVCGGELYLTKEMADSSKRDWSLVANPLYAKKG
jgi:hypothetical protein